MSETAEITTWDDIFSASPAPIQEIATTLRTVILKMHPDATATPKPGWGAVQYGFGAQNKDIHSYLMPQKGRVNLGFYFGTALPDPSDLLEGTGKALRHVKVNSSEQACSGPIAALIQAAIHERKTALGVT